MSLSANRTHVAQQSSLIDVMQEHGLEQIVNQPTRQHNILDLFFLNYPSTKYTINILPGLADHDIVCVDIEMGSEISKQNPREIYLYHRADWGSIKEDVITDSKEKASIFNSHFKSVFTNELDEVLPTKGPSPHPQISTLQLLAYRKLQKLQHLF